MDTLIRTKFQVMFDCCRCLLKSLDKYQMSQQFVLIKIYPSFERYHKGILSKESELGMTSHLTSLRNSTEKLPQTKTKTFQVENRVRRENINDVCR